jgi:hypothetical protein
VLSTASLAALDTLTDDERVTLLTTERLQDGTYNGMSKP